MANIDWDDSDFQAGIQRLFGVMRPTVAHALDKVANEILRLSAREVPHDKGLLQASGTSEKVTDEEVVVGYNKVYAARLHEHPEYRFQKGRKGKYLIDPIMNNLSTFNRFITAEVERVL